MLAFQQSTLRLVPTPEQHLARWHAVDSREEKHELVPAGMEPPRAGDRYRAAEYLGLHLTKDGVLAA